MESIRVRRSRRRSEGDPLCPQVQLVFRLSSLLGLSPLVFKKGKLRFSYALAVFSISISCGIGCFGVFIFHRLWLLNDISIVIIALINIPLYFALHISPVIDAYSNGTKYGQLFEELKMIDAKLSAIGVLKVHRLDWSTRFLMILIISLYFIIGAALGPDSVLLYNFIGIGSYILICSQIIAVGCHILSRYDLVVNTLDQLKNTRRNINNILEILLDVNHRLSRVVDMFSSCYRLQLLILTLYTFFLVSTRFYYILYFVPNQKLLPILFTIYFAIFVCINLLRITGCLSTIMSKSQQFDLLLYQLMIGDEDFGLYDNPKLKLHIAMKRNLIITACDFFTLDFSLVLSMAASVSTYLVMFVQFGRPIVPRN